jgi:phosphohistidine phosphatase
MKKIVIVRHAKAEDLNEKSTDFKRSLTKKGKNDSRTIAKRIKSLEIHPDLIISSPANRAIETAVNFAEVFDYPVKEIILDEDIYYDFSTEKLMNFIGNSDNKFDNIFIFGHNPSLSYFATYLLKEEKIVLPKTGAVGISFKMEKWKEIFKAEREMVFFENP